MFKTLSLVLVACLLFMAGPSPSSAASSTEAVAKVAEFVRSLQNSDGGFPSFAADSDTGASLDATFALISAGIDPKDVTNNGKSPRDYLSSQAVAYSETAGGAAKLALGVAGMGLDAAAFGGVDLMAKMEGYYDDVTGKYGDDIFAQSFFILAQAGLDRPVPPAALTFLEAAQSPDGGFAFSTSGDSDTNTTSLAVQALVASGVPASDASITAALAYLRSAQTSDGGFTFAPPGDSDPNSTAFVIQAIAAVGEDPAEGGEWDLGAGKAPLPALLSFQNPSTGAFQFFGEDSPFASYQALPALMLRPFPMTLSQATLSPVPSPSPTATSAPAPTTTAASAPSATPTPSQSPAPAASATAQALPATGGGADRSEDLPLSILLLSAGVALIGGAARVASRRNSRR